MNKTRLFNILLAITAIAIIAGGFLLTNNKVSAIGLISEPLVITNALRGETFADELAAFNSEADEAVFALSAEGDIADWVTFYLANDLQNPITELPAPAKSYAEAVVYITVPEDVANGEYSGKLSVTLRPTEADSQEKESRVSVSQRLSRSVTIRVTDNESPKLLVSVIPHAYEVQSNETLNIRLIYDNQGNVKLKPQVDLKLYQIEGNDKKAVYNVIYPYPDSELPVKPGEIREISPLNVSTSGLKDGRYIAELKFLHNGQGLLTKDFKFSIGEVTGDGRSNLMSILTIALVVIIIGLLGGIMKIRQKRSARARVDDSSVLAGSAKNSQKRANGGNSSQGKSNGKKNNKT